MSWPPPSWRSSSIREAFCPRSAERVRVERFRLDSKYHTRIMHIDRREQESQLATLACLQEAAWSGTGRRNDGDPGLISGNPVKVLACSFRESLVETFRAEGMREIRPRVIVDVFFDAVPVSLAASDLLARGANRKNAFPELQ